MDKVELTLEAFGTLVAESYSVNTKDRMAQPLLDLDIAAAWNQIEGVRQFKDALNADKSAPKETQRKVTEQLAQVSLHLKMQIQALSNRAPVR